MNESAFIPACNWKNAAVVACTSSNILCYSYKQSLVVVKFHDDGYTLSTIPWVHYKTLNGLDGAPNNAESSLKNCVVTCGEDGLVKLWCMETCSILKSHDAHTPKCNFKNQKKVNSPDFVPVVAVAWSRADPNYVLSASENGCLVGWYLQENVANKYGIKLKKVKNIACCPTDASLVAVANNAGAVAIVKLVQNGRKLQEIRACDRTVVDIAWQPSAGDSIIAVTSALGELSLWRSKTARHVKNFKLAPYRTLMTPEGGYTNIYPLLWHDENTLLTRRSKELAALQISSSSDDGWRSEQGPWRTIHELHKREFFAFAKCPDKRQIWTVGSDRHILCSDIETGEISADIGMLYGGGICVTCSPHDPNTIAFGCSDGCVRVWDVTKPTGSARIYSKNIRDRVMAVTWHPEKDHTLVYGTSGGRVGIIECTSGSAVLLAAASSNPVYNLEWGPPLSSTSGLVSEFELYVVTNQKLLVYPDLRCQKLPRDMTIEMNLGKVTSSAWKPDVSLLAVGTEDGVISIFRPGSYTACHTIAAQSSLIQNIVWHPQMTSSDTAISSYHDLLTCGSRDSPGDVNVFKVTQTGDSVSSMVFATLRGHLEQVLYAAWSPHHGAHLVTCSLDNTIQLWNVVTQTPLMNFTPTPGEMTMFAIWSPIDSDFIISGCSNFTVVCWRISTKSGKTTPPTTAIKRTRCGTIKKKIGSLGVMATTELISEEESGTKEVDTAGSVAKKCTRTVPKAQNPVRWDSSSATVASCHDLLKADDAERPALYKFKLLASEEVFEKKLANLKAIAEHQKHSTESVMLWQRDLKELLTKCIEDGTLTPSLLALAPSVSPRLWLQACQAYARQLRAQMSYQEAASYFVAGQQVEEAVKALMEGCKHVDAICLARLRLPGNEIINEIVADYAVNSAIRDRPLVAAECYIFLKQFDAAGKILSSFNDVRGLCAAALAYKKANFPEQELQMALQAARSCVKQGEHQLMATLCEVHHEFKVIELFYEIFKAVQNEEGALSCLWDIADILQLEGDSQVYASIQTLHDQSELTKNVLTWRVIHELALSICAKDTPIRCQHILKSLHSSQLLGTQHLYSLCNKLLPNNPEQLNVFDQPGGYGVSLRAFLCIALVDRLYSHVDEVESLLPRIKELYNAMLDEVNFKYHRAKIEMASLERVLSQNVVKKLPVNGVANGKSVSDCVDDYEEVACEENIDGVGCHGVEKLPVKGGDNHLEEDRDDDDTIACDVEEGGKLEKHGEVNGDENKTEKTDDADLNSENMLADHISKKLTLCNGDRNNTDDGKVAKLIDDRKKLLSDILEMENNRGVIPNPMRSFLLLRDACETLRENHNEAEIILQDIVAKATPLIS